MGRMTRKQRTTHTKLDHSLSVGFHKSKDFDYITDNELYASLHTLVRWVD
jgi:hypothetical protein